MLIEPQEVPGVSFQMSFAAVLALIAGYEVLRPRLAALHGEGGWRGKLTLHLAMLGLTSLLAGTASMPFGAYHFGRIQVYFVISNMVAVPLTAFWVMPLGLVALALMPLGLDRLAMLPMGWGVEAILWVARTTAALPAATLPVPHAPAWGLALVGLGMAWLGLWRGRHPAGRDRGAGGRAGLAVAGAPGGPAGLGRRAADRGAHCGGGVRGAGVRRLALRPRRLDRLLGGWRDVADAKDRDGGGGGDRVRCRRVPAAAAPGCGGGAVGAW